MDPPVVTKSVTMLWSNAVRGIRAIWIVRKTSMETAWWTPDLLSVLSVFVCVATPESPSQWWCDPFGHGSRTWRGIVLMRAKPIFMFKIHSILRLRIHGSICSTGWSHRPGNLTDLVVGCHSLGAEFMPNPKSRLDWMSTTSPGTCSWVDHLWYPGRYQEAGHHPRTAGAVVFRCRGRSRHIHRPVRFLWTCPVQPTG